ALCTCRRCLAMSASPALERLRGGCARGGGLGTGLALLALVVGLDNWWRFGSVVALGYKHVPLSHRFYEGFFGLLLSPGRGLLFYAPVTALTIAVPFVIDRKSV